RSGSSGVLPLPFSPGGSAGTLLPLFVGGCLSLLTARLARSSAIPGCATDPLSVPRLRAAGRVGLVFGPSFGDVLPDSPCRGAGPRKEDRQGKRTAHPPLLD